MNAGMTPAAEYTVFISHSHTDWAVASLLSGYIRATSAACLVDGEFLSAGDQFSPKIIANIRASHEVVVILSPRFKESRWFDVEVGAALGAGALVVPLLLNCAPGEISDCEALRSTHAFMMDDYAKYLTALRERVVEFQRSQAAMKQQNETALEKLARIQQELELSLNHRRGA
jgi:hypothetical protein